MVVACGALLSVPARGQSASDGIFTTSIDTSVVQISQCDVNFVSAGINGNYHYLHFMGDLRIDIAEDVDWADIVVFGSRDTDPSRHPSVSDIETMKHFVANEEPQFVVTHFKAYNREPIVFHGKQMHPEDLSRVINYGCGVLRVRMRNGDVQTDEPLRALVHKTF